jgi:CheY-like chemotaxis protein
MLPRSIGHVLHVGLIARMASRISLLEREAQVTAREAERILRADDDRLAAWSRRLLDREPFDSALYDILLPVDATTDEEAVALICEQVRKPALLVTPASRRAVEDFAIAAGVHGALATTGYDVDVRVEEGFARIGLRRYVARYERAVRKITDLAAAVPGVRDVEVAPGTGFVPPSLLPVVEVEAPTRVLLVDDEEDFVQTLSERLRTRRLDSIVALDGHEALEVLRTEEPDVMVLDLKMPGIDGIEVLRRVKREHPGVEVIILTGHGTDRERDITMELGAFAYLRKPVDIDRLTETLRAAYAKVRGRRKEDV